MISFRAPVCLSSFEQLAGDSRCTRCRSRTAQSRAGGVLLTVSCPATILPSCRVHQPPATASGYAASDRTFEIHGLIRAPDVRINRPEIQNDGFDCPDLFPGNCFGVAELSPRCLSRRSWMWFQQIPAVAKAPAFR